MQFISTLPHEQVPQRLRKESLLYVISTACVMAPRNYLLIFRHKACSIKNVPTVNAKIPAA